MTQSYTLQELNGFVRSAIEATLPTQYWLTAELSQVSERGHMYCDFVQKDSAGRTLATARGNCWQNTWRHLSLKFAEVTGGRLSAGMQVMVMVRATFSEVYGFSYNIIDIEPSYTLGDMARRRNEILKQLAKDGIMHCNQELPLPDLMLRIAVISARTAAGYGDFVKQIYGARPYRFCLTLFASPMQGDGTENGVLAALESILQRQDEFDAVVIIRGGGSVTDLACFDSYAMAQAVALFPLPVFTGIGHERDEVVLDHVAHTRLKTPTAVAAFLVEHHDRQAQAIENLQSIIANSATERLIREKNRINILNTRLPHAFGMVRQREEAKLDTLARRLTFAIQTRQQRERHQQAMLSERIRQGYMQRMQRERHRIEMLVQRLDALDPVRILERGYSMTTCNGRLLTSINDAPSGVVLTTRLADGEVKSVVQ